MARPIGDLMDAAMDKIHTMVDSNTVVGEPIVTPDGVTLIPVSRVSFGFASGGNDRTDAPSKPGIWAGSGAGVKVDPVGFLVIREGAVRLMSIQPPAVGAVDRLIDAAPDIMDRIEGYIEKFKQKKEKQKEEDKAGKKAEDEEEQKDNA